MIAVINCGMGNLGSIANMLKKAGADPIVCSDPALLEAADKLILPGVGAFDNGMRQLHERGLVPVLTRRVMDNGVPILGLCLGMQLFTRHSEEGTLPGLGWLDAETSRLQPALGLRVPHMGWNSVSIRRPDPIVQGLDDEARFYFVHSYYVRCADERDLLATTNYGCELASIVRRGNIIGTQFHPEKSHKFGLQLMRNFVERC